MATRKYWPSNSPQMAEALPESFMEIWQAWITAPVPMDETGTDFDQVDPSKEDAATEKLLSLIFFQITMPLPELSMHTRGNCAVDSRVEIVVWLSTKPEIHRHPSM